MWTKFGGDWWNTATCITENVTISFKHWYRRHILTSRCDVISDVINIKSTFWGLISDGLSISNVKMNLSEIFRNLQNGRHFEAWANFQTGIWVLHQDRTCHSLHFEILFDVLAQILTELWLFQNFTYFLISWPSYVTFTTKTIAFCVEADYICGPSLLMSGQKLRPVSRKMWQFHLKMNIEGTFWRHAVT